MAGNSGTPGKCLAATVFIGSTILGSSGGGEATGLSGFSAVIDNFGFSITQ
jgi:hypothetical protein